MIAALFGWLTPVAGFFYILGLFHGQRSLDDEPIDFSDLTDEATA